MEKISSKNAFYSCVNSYCQDNKLQKLNKKNLSKGTILWIINTIFVSKIFTWQEKG